MVPKRILSGGGCNTGAPRGTIHRWPSDCTIRTYGTVDGFVRCAVHHMLKHAVPAYMVYRYVRSVAAWSGHGVRYYRAVRNGPRGGRRLLLVRADVFDAGEERGEERVEPLVRARVVVAARR